MVPQSACERQKVVLPTGRVYPRLTAADRESPWLVARLWPVTTVHARTTVVEDLLELEAQLYFGCGMESGSHRRVR